MAETTQYITREGERWDTVAYRAYGDASKFSAIIRANPKVPILPTIAGGTLLQVPVLEANIPKTDSEKLPPWK